MKLYTDTYLLKYVENYCDRLQNALSKDPIVRLILSIEMSRKYVRPIYMLKISK